MKLVEKALDNPIQLALALGGVIALVYFIGRKALGAAADGAAGLVSGNSAITRNQTNATGDQVTAYQGRGVLGTLGAAANTASGGTLSSIGEALGGWIYDVTHDDYDPRTGLQTASKQVQQGAASTDLLWGPLGSITLRSSKR